MNKVFLIMHVNDNDSPLAAFASSAGAEKWFTDNGYTGSKDPEVTSYIWIKVMNVKP